MNGIKETCVVAFLGVNSWIDIRRKQVSLLMTAIFAMCGIIWTIYSKGAALDFLLCTGTGVILAVLSIFTEGAIGMGDGWLVMALGTVMHPEEFFSMIFIAVICSAVWAGIILMLFHKNGHTEIPFVPFLLLGYLGGILL